MCNCPHLFSQVGSHDVDILCQILPSTGDTWHSSLTAESTIGTDLLGHTVMSAPSRFTEHDPSDSSPCDFRRETPQRVHHVVDRLLHIQNLAKRLHMYLLAQIPSSDGSSDLGE